MAGATEPGPAEGGEFRFAGAVPAGRKLAKLCPGQRGDLSHRGGWAQGSSARKPEPVVSWHGVQPAASDPHGLEDRPALTRCGVTPDPGLTGPCRLGRSRPPGGWERAGSVPEGPNATRPPKACVMLCGKEGRPRARKARASLAGGARVNAPNHILPTTTGPSPVPHKSGQVPDTETAPMPPAKFSRAGFWRGMEGQGRADRSRSWHAVLPRKRGRTRSGTSCANKKPRKRLRLRGLDTWQ